MSIYPMLFNDDRYTSTQNSGRFNQTSSSTHAPEPSKELIVPMIFHEDKAVEKQRMIAMFPRSASRKSLSFQSPSSPHLLIVGLNFLCLKVQQAFHHSFLQCSQLRHLSILQPLTRISTPPKVRLSNPGHMTWLWSLWRFSHFGW